MRAAPLFIVLLVLLTGCAAQRTPISGPLPDPASQVAFITRPAVARVGCSVAVDWRFSSDLQAKLRLDKAEIRTNMGSVAGSGFVVDPDGYMATNAHVVNQCRPDADLLTKAWPIFLGQVGQEIGRLVTREEVLGGVTPQVRRDLKVIMPGGDAYTATVESIGAPVSEGGKDVAILKLPVSNLPSLRLFDSQQVSPPQSVFAVGYPAAAVPDLLDPQSQQEPTYTTGIVSAVKLTRQGVPVLQVSAPATRGNSGGPVVLVRDGAVSVVGIMTFGTQDFESFNFVFTSNTILDFVDKADANNLSGTVDHDYAAALQAMAQGEYARAVPLLENVLQLYPKHATAPALLERARASATAKPAPDVSLRLWIGGGLVGFAALGSLVMLITGRRRPVRPGPAGPRTRARARGDARSDDEATQEIVGPPGALVGLDHRRYALTPGGLMVGRDRGCEVVVNDQRVSKHHIWVGPAANGRGVEASDQGSRNGTYLVRRGGRPVRIDRAHLLPGDTLWLVPDGSLTLTYEI